MRRRTTKPADTEELIGQLVEFRVRGDDFWGTGVVKTRHDGGEVAIVGKLCGVKVGDTLKLGGRWVVHDRYGRQFKVSRCDVVLPSDTLGVVSWLAATLPQVSRRRAEAIVERFGVQGTWQVLDQRDAAKLCEIDGITPDRAQEILEAYAQGKGERDRSVALREWGLTDSQIARVVAEWGDDAVERIRNNPYDLMRYVSGFGWKRADEIALHMGLSREAPARIAAGVRHTLELAVVEGHCYSPAGALVAISAKKILGVVDSLVWPALERMVERGELVRVEHRVYLPALAQVEQSLAESLARRVRREERGVE